MSTCVFSVAANEAEIHISFIGSTPLFSDLVQFFFLRDGKSVGMNLGQMVADNEPQMTHEEIEIVVIDFKKNLKPRDLSLNLKMIPLLRNRMVIF